MVQKKEVKLSIWDTAGQERYRSIAPQYFRGAEFMLICFDISRRDSFEDLKFWINYVD